MNIKALTQQIAPLEVAKTRKDARSEKASDREPDGSANSGGDREQKRHLSPEELEKAIAHLKELKGVKDNNLSIRLFQKNGVTIVFVEDHLGKVIRRIPESELHQLTSKQDKEKGHLLDKSL
jgi:uncharacterized FlaG/YvyC family protein